MSSPSKAEKLAKSFGISSLFPASQQQERSLASRTERVFCRALDDIKSPLKKKFRTPGEKRTTAENFSGNSSPIKLKNDVEIGENRQQNGGEESGKSITTPLKRKEAKKRQKSVASRLLQFGSKSDVAVENGQKDQRQSGYRLVPEPSWDLDEEDEDVDVGLAEEMEDSWSKNGSSSSCPSLNTTGRSDSRLKKTLFPKNTTLKVDLNAELAVEVTAVLADGQAFLRTHEVHERFLGLCRDLRSYMEEKSGKQNAADLSSLETQTEQAVAIRDDSGCWYRALTKSTLDGPRENELTIHAVDLGIDVDVPPQYLGRLPAHFAEAPRQVFHCRVYEGDANTVLLCGDLLENKHGVFLASFIELDEASGVYTVMLTRGLADEESAA